MSEKISAVFATLSQGIAAHLLAAVFILSATGAVEAAVLTGPVVNPANGHTYYLLNSNIWTASENEAIDLGGHLTTINDADENAWVLSTFSFYGGTYKDLWIGLSDFASEGNWVWANGETSSFRNWSVGEPNNAGDQDYGFILGLGRGTAGYWDDYFNANTAPPFPLHGVVEIVPEPSTWALLALSGATLFLLKRRKQSARITNGFRSCPAKEFSRREHLPFPIPQ
ncbi:PEP-CTERM protein-sorting domain-containing protein [Terrimicrobium sacchariphilum]|uniref:PEP-CTERM protein-sorting domain-containing protein n=1 Tax=Terrimicrobium sacchariphilum TaxID=690879 RepID=A0A146G0R7_TERSA|nr:lectin-like protein [Terrimicrobium sacchariphilum]GAT31489.1 PEP-CTERM protein-sorting domain-containing protein [Terrimicrobium sacchariphilum]